MGRCAKGEAFKCPGATFYKFWCFLYAYNSIILLNIVHKLKCETN